MVQATSDAYDAMTFVRLYIELTRSHQTTSGSVVEVLDDNSPFCRHKVQRYFAEVLDPPVDVTGRPMLESRVRAGASGTVPCVSRMHGPSCSRRNLRVLLLCEEARPFPNFDDYIPA